MQQDDSRSVHSPHNVCTSAIVWEHNYESVCGSTYVDQILDVHGGRRLTLGVVQSALMDEFQRWLRTGVCKIAH